MSGFRLRGFWLALFALGAIVVSVPAVASAAFPGRNGRIAYVHEQDNYGFGGGDSEVSEIRSMLPNGSRPRRLLRFGRAGYWNFADPAYAPDGRKLAFSNGQFATGSSLYVVRASGRGQLRRLTRWREQKYDLTPGWAPDGRRIVYLRYRLGRQSGQIRVYRAERSRRIAFEQERDYRTHPVWSARGLIALSSGGGIFTMRPDGSHRRRVVAGYNPDWSPHGNWIVYERALALGMTPTYGRGSGIAMIRPSDGRRHVLTSDSAGAPAFSPDGKYVVFSRYDAATGRQAIIVMRLRDRRKRILATAPPLSNPSPMSVEEHLLLAPTWQPLPRRRQR